MAGGEQSPARLDLMRSLAERTRRFFDVGDASAVLQQAARDEAVRLHLMVKPATSERIDIDVHAVVGWLYWCRYHAAADAADQTDLAISLAVYSVLVQVQPDAVPEPILQHMRQQLSQHRLSSTGAERAADVNDMAVSMLETYALSHAPDQVDAAIDMFRLVLESAPPGDIV
jgi:hypothetical protein